jgi:hypothetical protein
MDKSQVNSANLRSCRFCGFPLVHSFVDLGMQPLCESFLGPEKLNQMEPFFPLHTYVCSNCFLVQLEEYVNPEDIFSEYAYFSSFSVAWLEHSKNYVEMIVEKLNLDRDSSIVEVASNDGYLLQYFVQKGFQVLGIEPAANVAKVAVEKGVPTLVRFFGLELAHELVAQGHQADLLIGNNVLAQVPDLNEFVDSLNVLLKSSGVITLEFPHLMNLIEKNQFDTIYHEHFSYFSFLTVEKICAKHGLVVFDVEELPTHGGSLRIYVRHAGDLSKPILHSVDTLRDKEKRAGIDSLELYFSFAEKVRVTKRDLLAFLIHLKRAKKSIVGYGAPGKGNTLLNYCGIRSDFLDYTVDRNSYKHGKFLPGTHIPIFSPEKIKLTKPDYVFILPWNIKDEIMNQLSYIKDWNGRFVVPIPEVKVYDAFKVEIPIRKSEMGEFS